MNVDRESLFAPEGSLAFLLVYATRYALGRRSGAAQDMEYAIGANIEALRRDKGCLQAVIRDIVETDDLGMPCDQESWRRVLTLLITVQAGQS
jgi:hypothetical protein